jgi:hypothetical protein
MIEQISANNQPLFESGSSTGQPIPPGALRGNDVDVSVQVNYASLVDKAMQQPQNDDQRVQHARQLLLSGELDSDRIIKETIENLLKYGI